MTKSDLKGKLAIDTSALIELIFCEEPGQKLKEALKSNLVEAWTTEIAIAELRYILCRKIGWSESSERVNKLLSSGFIQVQDTQKLINDASKIKCSRAISLPDCFTLALAHEIKGCALFARKEEDLMIETRRKPLDVPILFLQDKE
jgi:predicted nucleic acid-binding protein